MEIKDKTLENQEKNNSAFPSNGGTEDGKINMEEKSDLMDKVRNFLDLSFETIRVVIISLIIIFIVRSFVIQPFFVKGSSMMPNFHDGDYLIVNEIGYRLQKPQRGDVIIFKYPLDPGEYFIKRVIGLPGETVEIKDEKVTIYNNQHSEGFVLDESAYLSKSIPTQGEIRQKLNDGEYYVLGDNRTASSDSRRWGILDQKFIIGKAWVRAWPFNDFKVFEDPGYES